MDVKALIKNKGIGYWICTGASVLSLIMAIIIFASWDNALPNAVTDGYLIGIVLIFPILIQAAVTFFPIRFANLLSIALYGVAFGLAVVRVAPAFADYFNNVFYQGGQFGMCVFYAVMTIVLGIAGVVSCFFAQTKDDKYII